MDSRTNVFRLTCSVAFFCLVLSGLNCTPYDVEVYDGPARGRIVGMVVAQNGGPVEDVRVAFNELETFTDFNGAFRLDEVPPAEEIRLVFDHSAFLRTYATTAIEGWETSTVQVVMVPLCEGRLFEAQQGIQAIEDRPEGRYVVSIPPNGVADATGEIVSGMIEIHISPISIEGSPGDLSGLVEQDGEMVVVPLISYKMTDVTLTLPGDNQPYDLQARWNKKLNLAQGVVAQVELPLPEDLPASQIPAIGEEIPWWWWDPEVGHWVKDAVGTVDLATDDSGRLAFFSEWTHFSRHGVLMREESPCREQKVANVDRPPPQDLTCVMGQVVDQFNNPLSGAEVWAIGLDYNGRLRFRSDANGEYRAGALIVDTKIRLEATMVVDGVSFSGSADHDVTPPVLSRGWSLDVANSDCQEGPDLVIPLCYLGGEVTYSSYLTAMPGGEDSMSSESASARFFEPDWRPQGCQCALEDIPNDSCAVIDTARLRELLPSLSNLSNSGPGEEEIVTQTQPLPAGDFVLLSGSGRSLVLQSRSGHSYSYDSGLDGISKDTTPAWGTFEVFAPGQEKGVPSFTEPQALFMPAAMQLAGNGPTEIVRSRGFTLNWQQDPAKPVPVMLVVNQPQSDSCLVCMARDDGSFTVPADKLSKLQPGPASVMSLRSTTNFFKLPLGTYVRSDCTSGMILSATVR